MVVGGFFVFCGDKFKLTNECLQKNEPHDPLSLNPNKKVIN